MRYARRGDNTTRRISVRYDVDFVIKMECNRIEAERETGSSMESVVRAIRNVEKNIECSLPTNIANIPDLETILSVAGRQRTARFRKPQGVTAIVWETFRIHILRGVVHFTSSAKSEMDRWEKWSKLDRSHESRGTEHSAWILMVRDGVGSVGRIGHSNSSGTYRAIDCTTLSIDFDSSTKHVLGLLRRFVTPTARERRYHHRERLKMYIYCALPPADQAITKVSIQPFS